VIEFRLTRVVIDESDKYSYSLHHNLSTETLSDEDSTRHMHPFDLSKVEDSQMIELSETCVSIDEFYKCYCSLHHNLSTGNLSDEDSAQHMHPFDLSIPGDLQREMMKMRQNA
jgi:hypothetical protein